MCVTFGQRRGLRGGDWLLAFRLDGQTYFAVATPSDGLSERDGRSVLVCFSRGVKMCV